MRKRKALKGGYIGNPASTGPALKEPLDKIDDITIDNINKKYENLLDESRKDVQEKLEYKKAREKEYNDAKKEETAAWKIGEKTLNENKKIYLKILSGFLGFITTFIASLLNYFRQLSAFIWTNLLNGGQGVILKAIIAIVCIILAVFGFLKFSSMFTDNTLTKNYNDISHSILNTDYEKYLTMPNSETYMQKMQLRLMGLIPNQYKYKWGSLANSFSYITTGKNNYEEFLEPRIETKEGRCDDIFHINFNPSKNVGDVFYSNDRTYSIIEPKDVILTYNDNLYNGSDYNKIDSNIKALANYHNKCEIPIKADNAGKYRLSIENTRYYNDENLIENGNLKNIKKLFVNDENNNLKLGSFNNILYTGYYNSSDVIASYSVRLINPNYKGPILRLTSAWDIANQYNKNEKTANFYNEYKTDKLYCIILDKKVSFEDFFSNTIKLNYSIYIAAIYDQSGNDYNFIFEKNDNKYMPHYLHNDKLIKFYIRTLLILNKPIISKGIKINANISSLSTEISLNDISDLTKAKMNLAIFNNLTDFLKSLSNDDKKIIKDYILADSQLITKALNQMQTEIDSYTENDEKIFNYIQMLLNYPIDDDVITARKGASDDPYSDENKQLFANLRAKKSSRDYFAQTQNQYKDFKARLEFAIKKDSIFNVYLNAYINGNNSIVDIEKKKYEDAITIEKNKYVENYMSFLATKSEAIIKITNTANNLYLQYKDDSNKKSNNYTLVEDRTKLNNIELNIATDDEINIECLGNILDSRSKAERDNDPGGAILSWQTGIHSFRGYLSELRIFKNS